MSHAKRRFSLREQNIILTLRIAKTPLTYAEISSMTLSSIDSLRPRCQYLARHGHLVRGERNGLATFTLPEFVQPTEVVEAQ